MFRTICLNIVLLLLSSSCSKHVLKRNHRGQRVNTNRNYLNIDTIKKKVSILAIFNESHYGSDDLAVTVTEELKKEVRKTNQFICLIQSGERQYFANKLNEYSKGSSKFYTVFRKTKETDHYFNEENEKMKKYDNSAVVDGYEFLDKFYVPGTYEG